MNNLLEAVNKINSLVPIQKVVDVLNLEVKRDAVSYQVYECIFGHSDTTPSLHISREKNTFNCFACLRKGSTYKFVKEYLTYTLGTTVKFSQVVAWLSELEPEVASIKLINSQKAIIDSNKKKQFKMNLVDTINEPILKPELFTCEEKRLYITGIMKGFDSETLAEFIKFGGAKSVTGNDLLLSLIDKSQNDSTDI